MNTIAIMLLTGATLIVGCVSTTDVVIPECVESYSSFQSLITSEVTSGGSAYLGWVAVMAPNGWEATDGLYSGSLFSGDLVPALPDTLECITFYLEQDAPSPAWGYWSILVTDGPVEAETGDIWHSSVMISTDGLTGSVILQFLSGMYDESAGFDMPAYPCTVSVIPQTLSQETWGTIKAGFSQ